MMKRIKPLPLLGAKDFPDLGGNSLLTIELFNIMEREAELIEGGAFKIANVVLEGEEKDSPLTDEVAGDDDITIIGARLAPVLSSPGKV